MIVLVVYEQLDRARRDSRGEGLAQRDPASQVLVYICVDTRVYVYDVF